MELLRSLKRRIVGAPPDPVPGPAGVSSMGHRDYVGGLWETMGRHQFRFLIERGLRPEHVLLDVACGSLRGGVLFIPYLDAGNYLGIELEPDLIKAGVEIELGRQLYELKRPELLASSAFEFEKLSKQPDFALAQSLFTHLIEPEMLLCLRKLRGVAKANTRFFVTFFETNVPEKNPDVSHPHIRFAYSRQKMAELGAATGWNLNYIGEWNHPRNQMMLEYTPMT